MKLRTVKILGRSPAWEYRFFKWTFVNFCHTRSDGETSEPQQHLVFERGDSVGMLLHDLVDDVVIFVEQVRIATVPVTDGWLVEIPAGRIDKGETPIAAAVREIEEETGVRALDLESICEFFPSPGTCSERIHLFYCAFPEGITNGRYAGLESEGEDIEIHRVKLDDALRQLEEGTIIDAKAIIALRWLQARRAR